MAAQEFVELLEAVQICLATQRTIVAKDRHEGGFLVELDFYLRFGSLVSESEVRENASCDRTRERSSSSGTRTEEEREQGQEKNR